MGSELGWRLRNATAAAAVGCTGAKLPGPIAASAAAAATTRADTPFPQRFGLRTIKSCSYVPPAPIPNAVSHPTRIDCAPRHTRPGRNDAPNSKLLREWGRNRADGYGLWTGTTPTMDGIESGAFAAEPAVEEFLPYTAGRSTCASHL